MQDNYTFRVLGIINIFLKFVTILQALLLRHWYEIMALYYINSILTETSASRLDKAPRLSISIVIWILSSDTICQLNQFNTNSEAAMLSSKEEYLYLFFILFNDSCSRMKMTFSCVKSVSENM